MGHLIFGDAVATTYASAIMLREFYQKQDIDYIRARDWRYYFIVRRHFLRKKWKEHGGVWICHYCQKEMTVLQERGVHRKNIKYKQKLKAITIDHKHAVGNGGMILETENMVECCYTCNQKKGNKDYHEYMHSLN